MPPAQQRFQADHPFFRDIDQRLVINLKSVLNIGGPQQRFHVAAGLGAFIHLRFEESISAAPFGFGGVHGKIGALEQILRLVIAFGRNRNADASADIELIAVNLVRTPDQFDQPVREHGRAFGLVGLQLYDGEFVATEAGNAAERQAALKMLKHLKRGRRATLGADKSYQEEVFVRSLRSLAVTPHVAEFEPNPKWRNWLTASERNDPGLAVSQKKRKLVEKVFGWMKQDKLRQIKLRGLHRVDWLFQLAAAAHNLLRMSKLIQIPAEA